MLVDARSLPDRTELECDVCIIGAGAAGITLARELAGRPAAVVLLESGGLKPDPDLRSLSEGRSVGLPYFPLEIARVRCFGGTTDHWGGHCRPFAAIDFEPCDWIPHSGWPIAHADLLPYYERAGSICRLHASDWDAAVWARRSAHPELPLAAERVTTRIGQIAFPARARRFGTIYREEIEGARNVTTYLNASATELETDEGGRTVTRVHAACLTGSRFTLRSRQCVLAAGGIENPRLLLLSNRRQPTGLGNQHDLVGRFFLEHPRLVAATLHPSDPGLDMRLYRAHRAQGSLIKGYLGLPGAVQRRERLSDVQIRCTPIHPPGYQAAESSRGMAALGAIWKAARRHQMPDDLGGHLRDVIADIDGIARSGYLWARYHGRLPIERVELTTRIAPVPNPESRITLADERDPLGQRQVQLDWRLSPADRHSAVRTLEILGQEVGRAGIGRLEIRLDDGEASSWPPGVRGGWHHMGTTRMSDDPRSGVVDRHCRVHGVSNLHIAGSSVFTTAGSGTPTLTIVALALRLADRLREIMA